MLAKLVAAPDCRTGAKICLMGIRELGLSEPDFGLRTNPPLSVVTETRIPMSEWPEYYYKTLMHSWRTMGPAEYGYVLVTIGIIGYLMMKSTSK